MQQKGNVEIRWDFLSSYSTIQKNEITNKIISPNDPKKNMFETFQTIVDIYVLVQRLEYHMNPYMLTFAQDGEGAEGLRFTRYFREQAMEAFRLRPIQRYPDPPFLKHQPSWIIRSPFTKICSLPSCTAAVLSTKMPAGAEKSWNVLTHWRTGICIWVRDNKWDS